MACTSALPVSKGLVILGDEVVMPDGLCWGMNVTRHFSDTRTDQGRVRFLLSAGRVCLMAEGPGWTHRSAHATLTDAATFLAVLPRLGGGLYHQALDNLEHQLEFERGYPGAA